jgi:hypothetical protein
MENTHNGEKRIETDHGRMNYKDTKPYMSAFLSVDLLTDFAAFCLIDFIDWRYIYSWFVVSTQFVNCCPHGWRNYTCLLLPLYWTFSLTSSPLPPPSQCTVYCTVYRQCVTVGVGGCWNVLWTTFCRSLLSVSDQIQNLQNCFTTPNKNDQ